MLRPRPVPRPWAGYCTGTGGRQARTLLGSSGMVSEFTHASSRRIMTELWFARRQSTNDVMPARAQPLTSAITNSGASGFGRGRERSILGSMKISGRPGHRPPSPEPLSARPQSRPPASTGRVQAAVSRIDRTKGLACITTSPTRHVSRQPVMIGMGRKRITSELSGELRV